MWVPEPSRLKAQSHSQLVKKGVEGKEKGSAGASHREVGMLVTGKSNTHDLVQAESEAYAYTKLGPMER